MRQLRSHRAALELKMRVAIWSPRPPAPTGIADYAEEQAHALETHVEVVTIGSAADAGRATGADLDLYHLGNSPAHGFVYHAALERPGAVLLHDWSLHHLVLAETVERGDVSAYLRQMRRGYGETGTFVARQVARGLGGDLLPALFPLNDLVLERSLAVITLSETLRARAAARMPDRPVLHLPHHLALPMDPLPSREEARRVLGLPAEALVVTAPGLATRAKRIDAVAAAITELRRRHPRLTLVVAGEVQPGLTLPPWATATGYLPLSEFVRHLVAADVVSCLRFPSHGEMSGALVRAMGVGRSALVSAGTPAAEEFPEGTVVPVDAGPREPAHLVAVLGRLFDDDALRETIGRLARDHVRAHHDLTRTAERLATFMDEVAARKAVLLAGIEERRALEGSLLDYLLQEVRFAAQDLGLAGLPGGVEALVTDLARPR
jgi:glycosyltransferase involved in cell wall biosynthesis